MAIPTTQAFEEFIGNIRIVTQPEGPAELFASAVGMPRLFLEYRSTALSLDSVLRVISRELNDRGCVSTPSVALAVLGAIACTHSGNSSVVEHANACLANTLTADLLQYLVLPTLCRPDYELVFDEFNIRPFNPERLRYWAERGGSRFPLDLAALKGRTALERDRIPTRLLDWDGMPPAAWRAAKAQQESLPQILQDVYYAAVAEHYFKEIPTVLRERAVVLEAAGFMHVDVESLLDAVLSQRLALFRWRHDAGQRTWAVLSGVGGLNVNLVPPALLKQCRAWLQETLGFVRLDLDKPLDRTVGAFCSLLQRAHDHRLNQRANEASLHFVIAMDFVLGDERRSTESIAERAAVLTYRSVGRTLEEQTRRVKQVYGSRSKYVHEGRSIPDADIEDAERIATHVLWTLLSICGAGKISTTSDWLRSIDFVLASLRDCRTVPEADFVTIGVAPLGTARTPPNRVTGPL
jgi:hypothetical protein